MCKFCEKYYCLTTRDNKIHEEKINKLDGTIRYNNPLNRLIVDLLETGEGATWGNRRTSAIFKINFCPICGKHIGNNVEFE